MMRYWVDVGGTFTDGIVVRSGERRVGKVLSSSVIKGTVAEMLDPQTVVDPRRRGEPDRFWCGCAFRGEGSAAPHDFPCRVVDFDRRSGRLRLDRPLASPLAAGAAYELSSDLEAPVLLLRQLLELAPHEPLPPVDVRLGTTRGTNALLTRRGAPTGLAVTRGFADLLRIGQQDRPDLFALEIRKPPPLTEQVVEIEERLAADGTVLTPLDTAAARQSLAQLWRDGARSLAVCLLHGYRNGRHERELAEIAREVGFTEISLSCEVAPLIQLLPRAETTTLDAYLNPILAAYVARVERQLGGSGATRLRLMTSGGALVAASAFRGRDSILSGPAGGVVALAEVARAHGAAEAIGLDMGGTSTDVSRYAGRVARTNESVKAGIRILTPAMAIHTVAAGGGSLCRFTDGRLWVGPESAGADPGPACYGRGGPLAVTDLNLVLGRLAADRFPFPLDRRAAVASLERIAAEMESAGMPGTRPEMLAEGFWRIANGHMAEAVRTVSTAAGIDPRPMALVGFGGAAGQHLCAIAAALGIRRILDHSDASVLSALGMGLAPLGRIAARGIYRPLSDLAAAELMARAADLEQQARDGLADEIDAEAAVSIDARCEVRYLGTDAALELDLLPQETLASRFAAKHHQRYGYVQADRTLELVALRVEATAAPSAQLAAPAPESDGGPSAAAAGEQPLWYDGRWHTAGMYLRESLQPNQQVQGPALIAAARSTTVIDPGWRAVVCGDLTLEITPSDPPPADRLPCEPAASDAADDPVLLEIIARRLQGIAEQMGAMLQRTAVSVNVKQRRDYSCAVFRRDGSLVANAPHVPVHLGAMGHTVRHLIERFPEMAPGDCYLSNDPYAGGSHLPDVTAVTPVFSREGSTEADFFVASRAHHAEIGGISPGSMPPGAATLAEEGVVIRDFPLVRHGQFRREALWRLLTEAPYPSRTPEENVADLTAQLAAGRRGASDLARLAETYGTAVIDRLMRRLQEVAAEAVREGLQRLAAKEVAQGPGLPEGTGAAEATGAAGATGSEKTVRKTLSLPRRTFADTLDDGTPIAVAIETVGSRLRIDFTGSGGVHPRGFNATPAIVTAAVMYTLRCLIDRPLPLNEGVLRCIDLCIPPGLLHPPGDEDPRRCPAVVAGNVETSQRIVDVLLGALGVAAASQGTMNNLLLGDASFGYYETIGGGSGATATAAGADGVHTHMTNTRITDAEVLESRYPVRLRAFAIRRGSGGAGGHRGGEGLIRHFEMLRPLTLSLLTGRRGEHRPYGMAGGEPGKAGRNRLIRDGQETELTACALVSLQAGDQLRIETPGGGGWGRSRVADA